MHTHTHTHSCTHTYAHIHTHIRAHTHTHMHTNTHIHTRAHTHTHTHTHTDSTVAFKLNTCVQLPQHCYVHLAKTLQEIIKRGTVPSVVRMLVGEVNTIISGYLLK
jgi:hypothetical protein